MSRDGVIAWVESPLQLLGAAEWAHAHRTVLPVAGRLGPQMSSTAEELLARRASFGPMDPYLGIPWKLLASNGHWVVGDGFSGQFRLAATVLRPRRVTFLDDGANAVAFADALLGRREYARPGIDERGLTTVVAPLAHETVMRRAVAGRVEFFTAFDLGASRLDALGERGVAVRTHGFEWTRASSTGAAGLEGRIVLGSARVVDGRMRLAEYVRWVTDAVAGGTAVYLPHRRESAEQLAAVAAVAGMTVRRAAVPVELLLAGARTPLEVVTLPSSTTTTLPLVLAGTGSTVVPRPSRGTAQVSA